MNNNNSTTKEPSLRVRSLRGLRKEVVSGCVSLLLPWNECMMKKALRKQLPNLEGITLSADHGGTDSPEDSEILCQLLGKT